MVSCANRLLRGFSTRRVGVQAITTDKDGHDTQRRSEQKGWLSSQQQKRVPQGGLHLGPSREGQQQRPGLTIFTLVTRNGNSSLTSTRTKNFSVTSLVSSPIKSQSGSSRTQP